MRSEMCSGMEVLVQSPEVIANVLESDSQDKAALGLLTQQEPLHGSAYSWYRVSTALFLGGARRWDIQLSTSQISPEA